MFKKILIPNRGEIALRIIRTCKEMGIKTVALYSTADKDSLPVRFADEAVCIGAAASKDSYLNIQHIMAAAEITNADAIHPGYGFLSESAEFSRVCKEYGLKFIGPSAEMMAKMGDKAAARAAMKAAKVPVIEGSEGILSSQKEALRMAHKIGYPVLLKATAGGGGKGMRVVAEAKDLARAWETARQEARAAFGNDDMYMEKFITRPRHVEIQVAGDAKGRACHLSERECSIQRRHQKLIEETPSPAVDKALREKMGQIAIAATQAIAYEGVGTFEFLLDEKGDFYFIEMNTRIQVEHPITEEVTDFDLVKEQIKIAAGIPISTRNYYPRIHAIECRINAEDPAHDFRPCPGKITHLHMPGGRGVRVDTHVYAGYVISPYYDSMIAKLIVSAQSREEAILRMQRALQEMVIEGIKTSIPFHIKVMQDERFRKGVFSTHFLDDFDFGDLA